MARFRLYATCLLLGLAAVAPQAASGQICGATAPGNGTGYVPPSNPASLPSGNPAPGPAILHWPLAESPQLRNAGPWIAEPILISGTRVYREGEFLYQDFLYDDRALNYPNEPERYAGNAADIVEVRLKPLSDATAIRITFNSMLEVDAVATTIALGDSATAFSLPHNAGAVAPGQVFVTASGCAGDIVDAATGATSPVLPTVTTDLVRRQVEIRVPYAAFDPRGLTDVRVAAAAGLWDADAGVYLRPNGVAPAFFNVAFREVGEWVQNTWMDGSQNDALAAGDLSSLFASVDFVKLAAGVDDDLLDEPGGVPTTGPMNRIHVSHFEPVQGRGNNSGGDIVGNYRCPPPECTPLFSGRLQPYSIFIPEAAPEPDGYGLVLHLHGANSNHNHFEGDGPDPALLMWEMFSDGAGRPSILISPGARGPTYFYHDLAGADVFEVWADVAARFDLDPRYVVQSGSSMGGFGAYKMATQFPDLYVAAFPNIATNAAAQQDGFSDARAMFPSLRNVPVLAPSGLDDPVVNYSLTAQNAMRLDDEGYRYDAWWFKAGGANGHAEYRHHLPGRFAALMLDFGPLDPDPRRVTYVLNDQMDQPEVGLNADKAYWLSGLALADESAVRGEIDVVSRGFPNGDPELLPQEVEAGPSHNGSLAYERTTRSWGSAPPSAVEDVLDITATNVESVTIDVDRARVSCEATVNVDSPTPVDVTLVGLQCLPEPGRLAMLSAGVLGLVGLRRVRAASPA